MNVKLRVLSAGVLFFMGQSVLAQKTKKDTASTKDIEEVVVVGFGQKKAIKEITGSTGVISAKKLEDLPVASIDQALAGKVAGVQMGISSGQPGGLASVRIRGRASIYGNNSPIVILDGVRINSGDLTQNSTTGNILSSLNNDDIESVTFLKDAVSTAIYGSDAGAGVMIITTKQGKKGKAKFSFDSNSGFAQRAIEGYKTMNAAQYKQFTLDSFLNYYGTLGYTAADIMDDDQFGLGYIFDSPYDTNWRNVIEKKSAYTNTVNVGVSGGNDRLSYYSTVNYFTQEGIIRGTDFKRLAATNKMTYKATDKVTLGVDLMTSYTQTNTQPNGGAFSNPIMAQFFNQPTDQVYNPDGSFYYGDPEGGRLTNGLFNIGAVLNLNYDRARTARVFGNFSLNYDIVKNLSYKLVFAPEYVNIEEDNYWSPLHGDGYALNGYLHSTVSRYFNFNIQNILNYKFQVADLHKFNATLVQEAYKSDYKYIGAEASSTAASFLNQLNEFVKPLSAAGGRSVNTRNGYALMLSYNYDNILNLDLSGRQDNLSNFQHNNKSGWFWSAGAGLDISQIGPLKDQKIVNMAKIRASYGKIGNGVTASPYALYKYNVNYADLAAAYITGVNNPNLKWETVNPLNIGLDLGFFNNRITLTAEYFKKTTNNLVFALPLSLAQGQGSVWQNVGELYNKGFEFTLNANIVKGDRDHINWNLGGNFSTLKNNITKLYDGQDIVSGLSILREGQPVNAFYLRKWAGVDPKNGDPLWYVNGKNNDQGTTNNINLAQRDVQGAPYPKIFGGINTDISWKGFTVDAQMSFSFGNYLYTDWSNYLFGDGAYASAYPGVSDLMDYWTPTHTNAANPKPSIAGTKSSNSASTRFLHKGDFWRLRTLRLAYTFDNKLMDKTGLTNFTVYVLGNNIWTHTLDKTLKNDPDLNFLQTTGLELPPMKSYLIGVKFNF